METEGQYWILWPAGCNCSRNCPFVKGTFTLGCTQAVRVCKADGCCSGRLSSICSSCIPGTACSSLPPLLKGILAKNKMYRGILNSAWRRSLSAALGSHHHLAGGAEIHFHQQGCQQAEQSEGGRWFLQEPLLLLSGSLPGQHQGSRRGLCETVLSLPKSATKSKLRQGSVSPSL